jgi:hypothetical protein
MKLDGYTNDEIAGQIACTRSMVERRLQLIRVQWNKESRHERSHCGQPVPGSAGTGTMGGQGLCALRGRLAGWGAASLEDYLGDAAEPQGKVTGDFLHLGQPTA